MRLYLIIGFAILSCGRNNIPQKTEEPIVENISYYSEGTEGETFESVVPEEVTPPCPPAETIYVAKKVKIRKSNNVDNSTQNSFNEINDLKRSVQVRDSQIDSLQILLGKKCKGEQTNNGTKWWVFVLLGMGIGVSGYQGIRSAITKKL